MRIVYVCSDPGIPVFGSKGASLHAQAVLAVLVTLGHDVHLCTPRPGGTAPTGVTVHTLPAIGRGPAAERERAARRSDAAVAALLDALAPELVYERYSLWARTATAWAQAHRVPSVLEVNAPLVTEQATHRELVDVAGAEAVATAALSAASAVVCVSDGVAAWARTVSAHPHRVHTVANGVDTVRVQPARRPATPAIGAPFTVGFVGTLKAWHGVEVLVAAVLWLHAADPTWRLLVVGDGPVASALTAQAAPLGAHVELTGSLAPTDVAAQLHRMDVACAPYPPQEPFYFSPLKVYEYLAAGLPVVASAIGQIPGALEHGQLGVLVTPGDVDALVMELTVLRADVQRRVAMSAAGRAAACEHHTWAAVVTHSLELASAVTV